MTQIVSINGLYCCVQVGVLTGLQELYVSSNSLTALSGALPATQLKYVDLSFNEIQSVRTKQYALKSIHLGEIISILNLV